MKMFLTRMGRNSRIVVTGDTTQVDLPPGTVSGLADAGEARLREVPGIGITTLAKKDIVRHPLVQSIVDAYDTEEPVVPPLSASTLPPLFVPVPAPGAVEPGPAIPAAPG